ncbi:uncharacterized protein SAPINGB_P002150 [Magnusiomyces paraingens]|uniref:Protein BIG1 n=1 Tax=Magnusiomyces paraingens TaxID=2606893 RepID=A0A5E8BKE9_9ASCO|nr:uncharacterized protein SAPINGB_P002150 [Saprochaete ingens]VVT49195.1 unnamed protein product [Saprochaete ingens]
MLFSRKSVLAVLALAQGAMSFGDTSPQIFLASTADLNTAALQQSQVSSFTLSSSAFDSAVASTLSGCPADAYIFVNQPAAHTYDLADSDGTANLRHYFQQATSKFIFPHVRTTAATAEDNSIPETGLSPLAQQVAEKCSAKIVQVDTQASGFEGFVDTTPRVVVLNFPTLPSIREKDARVAALQHNDNLLSSVIGGLPSGNYVIVYTSASESTAPTFSKRSQILDADDEENVLGGVFQKNTESQEDIDAEEFKTEFKVGDSLFEKYQYFSPGIFETTLVALALLYIFFSAYGWISTLEISYNAFDKPPQIPSATKAQ